MTTALASAPPVDRPGLPLLARVVAVGHTARATYRRAQAFRALLAARRQLRTVAHPIRDRAAVLAELAARLLVIDGVDLDVIGVAPTGPCLVVVSVAQPRHLLSILAAVPAAAVIERGPLAGPTGVRLGVRAPAPGPGAVRLAVGHAIEALRAGVPVVTTPSAVGAEELFGLAALIGAPVATARVVVGRSGRRHDVIVRAPRQPRPGESSDDFRRRLLAEAAR